MWTWYTFYFSFPVLLSSTSREKDQTRACSILLFANLSHNCSDLNKLLDAQIIFLIYLITYGKNITRRIAWQVLFSIGKEIYSSVEVSSRCRSAVFRGEDNVL